MKIDQTGAPMMARHEYEYIRDLINQNGLTSCLEWGSGNSTLYFPKNCTGISKWVSVEDNGHYLDYLNNKKLSSKVSTIWIPESQLYYQMFERSVNQYDFILVDGLYRNECIETGMSILCNGGILVLHDSGRSEYKEIIDKFPHEKIFDGEQPVDGGYAHRGITIFRK